MTRYQIEEQYGALIKKYFDHFNKSFKEVLELIEDSKKNKKRKLKFQIIDFEYIYKDIQSLNNPSIDHEIIETIYKIISEKVPEMDFLKALIEGNYKLKMNSKYKLTIKL